MLAFGLCLLLFCYFLFVGSAVVRTLHASRSVTQDLLLSPVFGVLVTLTPLFFINRTLGVPVMYVGKALTITLSLAALVVHLLAMRAERRRAVEGAELTDPDGRESDGDNSWALRPVLRTYLPLFLVLVAGAALTGRPMFTHGFDWLSFCNNDMANYCLSADWFYRSGFSEVPKSQTLISGVDYSQCYWFYHVPSMVRAGSELMLAWSRSLVGLSSQQIFMPTIVSFHMVMVGAGAAMVMTAASRWKAAFIAAILLAGSAQLTFGTVYQLIAQGIGLAVLATNATLLYRTFDGVRGWRLVRHGALLGLGITGQFLIYPEVNPFLAGGFVVFVAVAAFQKKLNWKSFIGVLALGGLFVGVFLNDYLYDALVFMYNQRKQASASEDPTLTLFPFFLIPSGFANFWGFVQITSTPPEPWFSVAIILGAVLLLGSLAVAVWLSWKREPAAALAFVCAGLGIFLFINSSGFGLYKLAMFAQVFFLPTIALGALLLARKLHIPWAVWLMPILAIPSIRVQYFYVEYSQDIGGATFNEVEGATRTKILHEFRRELDAATKLAGVKDDGAILCDSYNISLTKLLASFTVGRTTAFPSSAITLQAAIPNAPPELARQKYLDHAKVLSEETFANVYEAFFEFDPKQKPKGPTAARFFFYDQGGRPSYQPDRDDTLLVAGTGKINLLNRRRFGNGEGNFEMLPLGEVRNHLLFVHTFKSLPYYSAGDPTYISIYQLERDPIFYTNQTMAGVGRYFVFEVLNPDEEVRFCLDLTMSLKSDGQNRLPDAVAVGTERVTFPLVGRGACRVFSPPIKPQEIRGRYYVGIDLGEFGTQFSVGRTGMMKMFGMNVRLDRRKLVGFGRDISLVGPDEYEHLAPPSGVYSWGSSESQLRDKDLEFSGICEDGWVAETGYIRLGQKPGESKLLVRGFVPELGNPSFSTKMTVKVDGKPIPFTGKTNNMAIADGKLVIGEFSVTLDVPDTGKDRREVTLEFSNIQSLKGLDTRKASACLRAIAFEKPQEVGK